MYTYNLYLAAKYHKGGKLNSCYKLIPYFKCNLDNLNLCFPNRKY